MLKGRWGTGKTWFVENFVSDMRANSVKVLYISLYGIADAQQIDDEFFRQLHPILSSKGAAFAGRLLKGVVKGTLKFDWDGDKKEDGNLTVGIPDLNLPEYLRNTNGLILIFDDLERCSMPIADMLGYINYFVEHDGRKVLLVCNEEVLLASNATDTENAERNYAEIKEKLVGKSFELEPDYAAAIEKFLAAVNLESTRETLISHTEVLKRVYANAAYKNLRHLRQAILDFARIIEILQPEVRKKSDLVEHLLTFFLIYSFETKSGTISPSQIGSIRMGLFEAVRKKPDDAKENLYKKISEKYKDVNIIDSLLSAEIWQSYFETGLLDEEVINNALRNSKYFLSENQPDWVRLWNMFDLSDTDLERVLFIIDERFRNSEIGNIGELMHIVSSLMLLSELGIYKETKENITLLGLKNAEIIYSAVNFGERFEADFEMRGNSSYAGLAFHGRESIDFNNFATQMNEVKKRTIEKSYPRLAQALLLQMQNDTPGFVAELIHNNYRSAKFVAVPILSYINSEEFVQALQDLQPKQIDSIRHMVGERYASSHFGKTLQRESQWLRQCADELAKICALRSGKMSSVIFGHLKTAMLSAAEKIDNF